ncbi:MAG TPA: hypothetical protein PK156_37770 [Polyangium sp.]|nr:hypothetical protein [Polyangium sp.]
MRPYLPAIVAFVSVSSLVSSASAKDSDCPDGAWFCETEANDSVEEAAPRTTDASRSEVVVETNPVTVEQSEPAPRIVIIIMPDGKPVEAVPLPPPTTGRVFVPPPIRKPAPRKVAQPRASCGGYNPSWKPEVGFDIHAQRFGFSFGVPGKMAPDDAHLTGGGANLRFHLRPKAEIDVGNEFAFGKDFNGLDRGEIGLTGMLVRHFNPDSRLRFYGLGGGTFWFGSAYSDKKSALTPEKDTQTGRYYASYGALGLQAGLGSELRLSQLFSFHVDVLATFRWRFASSQDAPEYFDPHTKEAMNTSPGFLLRGGITFWPPDKKAR